VHLLCPGLRGGVCGRALGRCSGSWTHDCSCQPNNGCGVTPTVVAAALAVVACIIAVGVYSHCGSCSTPMGWFGQLQGGSISCRFCCVLQLSKVLYSTLVHVHLLGLC
jgi:hypothetical protein